jgi:hypothetical protein
VEAADRIPRQFDELIQDEQEDNTKVEPVDHKDKR